MRNGLPPWIRYAAYSVALASVGFGLWSLIESWQALPLQDQWEFIFDLDRHRDMVFPLKDLWRPHTEHRILLTRLILYLDAYAFDATNIFPVAGHFVLMGSYAAFLAHQFSRDADDALTSRLYAALCFGILLSAADTLPIVQPFNIQFTLALLGASGAIAAVVATSQKPSWLYSGCAAGSAAFATAASVNGLLAWPLAIGVALILRLPLRHVGVLVLGAGVMLLLYFPLGNEAEHAASLTSVLARPFAIVRFVGLFISGPLGQINADAGRVLGLLLAASSLWFLGRFIRHPGTWSHGRIVLLGTALFVLGTAILTALGRLDLTARAPRYEAMPLTFMLCLVGILLGEPSARGDRRFLGKAGPALALGIAAATLAYGVRQAGEAIALREAGDVATASLVSGIRDDAALAKFYPSAQRIWEVREFLLQRRLSVFAFARHNP